MEYPAITKEQEAALIAFADYAGRYWKAALLDAWQKSETYRTQGHLQALRNSHGPSWLRTYKLPKGKSS